jgi:hypothetical protein
MTRRDVLERNVDLINHAVSILSRQPVQSLRADMGRAGSCRVTGENVDRVDAYVDDHPRSSRTTASGRSRFAIRPPRRARQLRLEGFRRGELVAATRLPLG